MFKMLIFSVSHETLFNIMSKRYVISISKTQHEKVSEQSDLYALSMREYCEAALHFFSSRGINPVSYNPAKEFDTVQVLKKSTDRIISFIKFQEQNILSKLIEEVVMVRLLQEGQLNLLIENLVAEEDKVGTQQAIVEYVEQYQQKLKNEANKSSKTTS